MFGIHSYLWSDQVGGPQVRGFLKERVEDFHVRELFLPNVRRQRNLF